MARSVAARRPSATASGPWRGEGGCGFCRDVTPEGVRHDYCPGTIHTNPGKANDVVWSCNCSMEGHQV